MFPCKRCRFPVMIMTYTTIYRTAEERGSRLPFHDKYRHQKHSICSTTLSGHRQSCLNYPFVWGTQEMKASAYWVRTNLFHHTIWRTNGFTCTESNENTRKETRFCNFFGFFNISWCNTKCVLDVLNDFSPCLFGESLPSLFISNPESEFQY